MAKSSRAYDITVPANSSMPLNVGGEFYYVLECNLTDFLIGIDDDAADYAKLRSNKRIDGEFQQLRFENNSGSSLVVKAVIGFGAYGDDEVNITGSVALVIPATQTPGTDLAILTGTTQAIAASATRKECLIQADGELRLSGVTSKGFIWDGSAIYLTHQGAIDFFNDTAGTVTVTYTELKT